jgi:protoporphyrin/coproporphyrin ferrochelatase
MRNWHPYLADTLREMHADGVRRAVGFILPPRSTRTRAASSIARTWPMRALALRAAGLADVEVTYVPSWFAPALHRGQRRTRARRPRPGCPGHSGRRRASSSRRTASRCRWPRGRSTVSSSGPRPGSWPSAGMDDWALVYQSRSGRPEDPWLEPDVCDYLREARAGASRLRCSARSASSATTSRCCTTSTARPPPSVPTSGCR